MTDCKYWKKSWCCAPDDVKTNATNKVCLSKETCPYLLNQSYEDKSQMTNRNYSEHAKIQRKEIQKQIEELQTTLKLLEIEENRKTPCEKAYRDAYGYFPITDSMSGGDNDYIAWDAFQKGWGASRVYYNKYFLIANSKQEEVKKLQEKEWTYKITDEKGEDNPYKQYLNDELLTSKGYEKNSDGIWEPKKHELKTLWRRFYDAEWSDSACDEFCEIVEEWLPKPIDETCGLNENDADWNRGYNTYREYLMMQLK